MSVVGGHLSVEMVDLGYVKQGAESEFVFIDNYETTGTPISVRVYYFFSATNSWAVKIYVGVRRIDEETRYRVPGFHL